MVDSLRAMNDCEEGLKVQATLKKLFDPRQRELDAKQDELQKEREALEKQRNTLKPDAFQARAEKWQRETVEVLQSFVHFNREMQKKQAMLTQPILQRLRAIVTQLAKSEGFTFIVDRQGVLFADPAVDLTDRVINRLNEMAKGPATSAPKK